MPTGYHVQAISTDQTLDFNDFVWNVESSVEFDYETDRFNMDSCFKVFE